LIVLSHSRGSEGVHGAGLAVATGAESNPHRYSRGGLQGGVRIKSSRLQG